MGVKLGDAFVAIRGDADPLEKDLGRSKKRVTTWTIAMGGMVGDLMGGVIKKGAELAGRAVVGLGRELLDMTMDAAAIEGVTNTFDRLVQSVGGDAVQALEALRVSTRGMVADSDLLNAGNKFLAMGLAGTTEEAAKLAEIATQLGSAMGEDATASMENFALMMANQSIPRLDSFGISSGKVRTRITELMEATEGLTREAAFNQAVMEQARVTMERVGEQGDTAGGAMARIQATIANLRTEIGKKFLPVAGKVLKWGADLLTKVAPPIIAMFDKIAGGLDGMADKFGDRIEDIWAWINDKLVPILNTLWDAWQALINGDIEGFWGRIGAVLVELGVPIQVFDAIKEKSMAVVDYWLGTLKPAVNEVWKQVFRPALEGLWDLLKDLGPLLPWVGGLILLWIVAPMVLAALPVIALGAALVALGLIWREYGDQVKVTIEQIGVILEHTFRNVADTLTAAFDSVRDAIQGVIDWVHNLWDDLMSFELPDWLSGALGGFGLGGLAGAQGNDQRSVTVYGGIQQYGGVGGDNPLASLWEVGQ